MSLQTIERRYLHETFTTHFTCLPIYCYAPPRNYFFTSHCFLCSRSSTTLSRQSALRQPAMSSHFSLLRSRLWLIAITSQLYPLLNGTRIKLIGIKLDLVYVPFGEAKLNLVAQKSLSSTSVENLGKRHKTVGE